jgi:TFIIF-interacting CTD phosphatase-like protein
VTSKLLVLDLDETLIYGSQRALTVAPSFVVGEYFIYERPNVREFLAFCLAEFQIAVWTSASEDYAAAVVSQLFGGTDNLAFLWARTRCTLQFDDRDWVYLYTKNLKKVKRLGYALEQVIVVDNTAEKWKRQYGNLVQVSDFDGDLADNELADLRAYLMYLNGVANIRAVEKRGWRSNSEWRRV